MIKKKYYKYPEFKSDINKIIDSFQDYKPDVILAVARGGMTFGHFLGEKLNIRKVYTINSISYNDMQKLENIKIFNIPSLENEKNILIVDDIIDTGDTINHIIKLLKTKFPDSKLKTASLFYKESAIIKPDFTVHKAIDWIEIFWSED